MVMFPQQSEQLMTAMRVEKLGAGICMGIENEMKYNLVETCNKIMNNQPYYENARFISGTFRESGGYEIGVQEILDYVRFNENMGS
jgi:UDP:flavonoid glycosyltransferase YjiC (YdhE family)